MTAFDPDQALTRYMELHHQRDEQIDERPALLRRLRHGDYDFEVEADYHSWELQKEAEHNGYYLDWDFDEDQNEFEYSCRKMPPLGVGAVSRVGKRRVTAQ